MRLLLDPALDSLPLPALSLFTPLAVKQVLLLTNVGFPLPTEDSLMEGIFSLSSALLPILLLVSPCLLLVRTISEQELLLLNLRAFLLANCPPVACRGILLEAACCTLADDG